MVSRERRSANPEHYQEYDRKWRMANPKSVRTKAKKWRDSNKESIQAKHRRCRVEALVRLGGVCAFCQCSDMRCLQIDHFIPLRASKGRRGLHSLYLDIKRGETENLQVL